MQAGDSKAGLEAQLTKVVREKDQMQSELVLLRTETSTHKDNVCASSKTPFQSFSDKCLFPFQISFYEDKIKKVHEEMFKYQVENSTLQSQSSSLLAQINQLQVTQADLEGFKRKVSRTNSLSPAGVPSSKIFSPKRDID